MIIKQIEQLTNYLQALSKKEFQQYLIVGLVSIGILATGTTYYIYQKSSDLVTQLRQLNRNANNIARIVARHEKLQDREQNIITMLEKYPAFNINSYFERFYTKHKITPEPNWKPEEGAVIIGSQENVKFQEIILQATFKNQTMQKLVELLQDLYKETIVYIKELEVRRENTKITIELTLATQQYKKDREEAGE